MKSARTQKGFTLTEMLVAIALTAIVGAIAVPSAVQLLAQYELSSAANDVAFEVSRAKMQAVAQNRFVRIAIGSDGTILCRQTASTSTDPWAPSSCETAQGYVRMPRAVSTSGVGPIFDRNGMLRSDSTNWSMSVINGAGQKTITSNILGRIRIS